MHKPSTAADWLRDTSRDLQESGIGTARLDALVLLEDCIGRDRAHLLAHPEMELTSEQIVLLDEQIKRRLAHEPLAYIRGKTEFYGREFGVNKNVLEPRPESETMIDLLKTLPQSSHAAIVDVGTGSGALAITAQLECQNCEKVAIYAIDIDENCLEVAKSNATSLQADVTFLVGDLLEPLRTTTLRTYKLLCNLPYVPDNFHINEAASHEPKLAIFGGTDGLDPYRKLFSQIDTPTTKPSYILTESLPPQHEQLAAIASQHGYKLKKSEDFIQVFTLA